MRNYWFALVLGCVAATTAGAADWGSLKGRFVFDGKAEDPKALNINKDTEFCGKHDPTDESLVVGEDGGLQNAFIYLYVKRGKDVEVHPDLEKISEPAVLDNQGCRFEPHALVLRTGQELKVVNSDSISHNTNTGALIANAGFNETVPKDSPLVKTFDKRESFPSEVVCNIHPWMKSYLLIRDNPYMAVTDEKGNFEIKNLPAGKHEFVFWHGPNGVLKSLKVGKTKTSKKGRAKLEIKAGETLDLGEVKVSGKMLGI